MVVRDYLQPEFYHFNDDSLWMANHITEALKTFEETNSLSLSSMVLIDVGAGCGIIGIELFRRFPNFKKLILIEPQIDFEWFLMANAQTFLNSQIYAKTKILQSTFAEINHLPDWNSNIPILIVSNPPYFLPQQGRKCHDPRRHMCRHWSVNGLREWAEFLLTVKARKNTRFYWLSPTSVVSNGHQTLGQKHLVQLRAMGDLQIE